MKALHSLYGKKLLVLPILLLLTFSLLNALNVNIIGVSAGEYPAIYIDPATTVDPTLTPGKNYTISIKTDYNGSDVWGWQFSLTYNPSVLNGTEVTNGDLITKDKSPFADFIPGTFNNTLGELSLTTAFFFFISPPPVLTSGPGTLANVTFTVVGIGASDITLGIDTWLVGRHGAPDYTMYNIIDAEATPDNIQHGYFANVLVFGWINGTVIDAKTGSAIVGAKMTADGVAFDFTNETGYYSIMVPAPGTYNVTALASGYYSTPPVTGIFVGINATEIVDFALTPKPGAIAGTVMDASTGGAIVGAIVTANGYDATTDVDGHYNIIVQVGTYNITASMSGYYDGVEYDVSVSENATTTVNFELQLIVGWIDGYVTDAKMGYPILLAGVRVEAVSHGKNTDDAGYYKIETMPGVYTVNASKDGYYSNSTSVTVVAGETTRVDFALQPIVGWINGTVMHASTGGAIVGAIVTANGYNATTDADGHYNITVPVGKYPVIAETTGYYSDTKPATVVAGKATTVDFALQPIVGWINGTVMHASTGDPIEGVSVTANGVSVSTGADGSYSIELAPGTYDLTVSADGYEDSSQTITVVDGETTTVNFELTPVQPLNILLYAVAAAIAIIAMAAIAVYIIKVRKTKPA